MYILWGPWNINNWLGTHPVWGRPLLTNIYNALVQCNLPLYRVWQKCVKETDFRFTRYSKNVLHQPLAIKCIVYRLLFETNVTKVISNKFEVSKIYMTACMCIYKFCQTKEYLFMIFFCFIQKPEGYFYDSSWFFMFYSRSWMFYMLYVFKRIFMFYYI